jgi:hypothetical protein
LDHGCQEIKVHALEEALGRLAPPAVPGVAHRVADRHGDVLLIAVAVSSI